MKKKNRRAFPLTADDFFIYIYFAEGFKTLLNNGFLPPIIIVVILIFLTLVKISKLKFMF